MSRPRPGLGQLDPDAHLRDPARKQRYVTTLFDTIAPSYDRFTRWFSFGRDHHWKAALVRWAVQDLSRDDLVVDLACGTGDVAAAVGRTGGRVRVVGVDLSREMLAFGIPRHRAAGGTVGRSGPPVRLIRADMLAIPVRSGSAAAVTVGYGFRNVPDLTLALAEAARVLRPGGRLASLDFFLPEGPRWRRVFRWYLRCAGRLVGRWWHAEPEAYGYIDRSLGAWLTPAAFSTALEAAGFEVDRMRRYLGGGICLHQARKPG